MKNVHLLILFWILLPFGITGQLPASLTEEERDSLLLYATELSQVDPQGAITYAREMRRWSVNENDSLFLANALLLESSGHYALFQFNEARQSAHQALDLYRTLKDSSGVINALIELANIEAIRGSGYEALLKLEEALAKAHHSGRQVSVIRIHTLISRIHLRQSENDKALKHALEALKVAKASNLKVQRGIVYNLLARINLSQGDIDKAAGYVDYARLIHRGLGQSAEVAETYTLSAEINLLTGNLNEAEAQIRQALAINDARISPYQQARQFLTYSQIAHHAGDTLLALEMAEKADRVAAKGPNIPVLDREIHQRLVDAYLLSADSASALRKLLTYNQLNDSIREYDFQKLILRRNMAGQEAENRQLEKKNRLHEQLFDRSKLLLLLAAGLIVVFVLLISALMQNILRKKKYNKHLIKKNELIKSKTEDIKKQQGELAEKNKRLEEMDKAKNKIFSVISHDLRQPITQIKSVLNLLEAESMSDEERVSVAGKLKESVDNSSNALENLLLWSKKQLTGITTTIVDIHLLPQIWQLESQIKPNLQAKNISLNIKVPDFFKIQGDMNQLDICLKNLVNNAIKFTNPGGQITISAFSEASHDVVQVSDNGVGMDPGQLAKLQSVSRDFTTMGTMSEKGTGLGVLLVQEFMANQNGELRIESTKGQGSSFSLLFPKENIDYRK